jgi:YD repeat-containing protein
MKFNMFKAAMTSISIGLLVLFGFSSVSIASSCSWNKSQCVAQDDTNTYGAFCDIYNCNCGPVYIITPTETATRCRQPAWICGLPGVTCCPHLLYDVITERDELSISQLLVQPDIFTLSPGATVSITGTITELAGKSINWSLGIAGQTFSGNGASVNVIWNGKDGNGNFVPSGNYTASLNAKIFESSCSDSKSIAIKVVSPSCDLKIESLTGTSKILNPASGSSVGISGSIFDSSGQAISWILNILDQTFTGTGKSVNAIWDGKYADGTVVQPGSYSAKLTSATADAQCTSSKTANFTVTEAEDGQCGLYVQFGSMAHIASGNLAHSQDLFSSKSSALPAGLSIYYNSLDPHNGSLGRGWSHNYDITLKENFDGSVLISKGNWKYEYFTLSGGAYTAQVGNYSNLVKNADRTFTLTSKDGLATTFSDDGKATSISDRNTNTTSFAYAGSDLTTATDPYGRTVEFTYDNAHKLISDHRSIRQCL